MSSSSEENECYIETSDLDGYVIIKLTNISIKNNRNKYKYINIILNIKYIFLLNIYIFKCIIQ